MRYLILSRRQLGVVLVGCSLIVATMAFCQQVKRTRTGTVTAQTMELDWEKNVVIFSGNARLVVSGEYNADMTAPSMNVALNQKGDRIMSLVAKGPVTFTVITQPDATGLKRKIVASASDQATYSEDAQQIKLVGNAVADMMPVGGEATEAMHFTGQTIVANLKTNRLTVDNANLTVKTQTE